MKKSLTPRESGKFISENSIFVKINHEGIPKAVSKLQQVMARKKYSIKNWKKWPLHPKIMDVKALHWILTVDTLNFSFWLPRDKPQFQVEHHGKFYEDYEALCACINRAVEEGINITTPSYMATVGMETVKHVFRSSNNTTLPMLEERMTNLRQVGSVLCQYFDGTFEKVLERADKDVTKLIHIVTSNFSCFNDVGIFESQPVQFQKRVQILIADIWACFEGAGFGEFRDIGQLTMFPDYRVPQSLLFLEVISYTNEFFARIHNEELLPRGEREEMEIRGCSIHAVELISQMLNEASEKVNEASGDDETTSRLNSVLIDFYLWDFATENFEQVKEFPEHRTRSIYY